MVDERAFLAALATQPDDSGRRLVYSDWLEEGGRCPEAFAQRLEAHRRQVILLPDDDAPRLKYAEVLADNGHAGPAEFIRAQVELAKFTDYDLKYTAEPGRIRGNMSGNWKSYANFFSLELAGFGVAGLGKESVGYRSQEVHIAVHNHVGPSHALESATNLVFRRGFVERVECLWRAWWGPPNARGSSDTYPRLNKVTLLHPVTAVTFADPPDVRVDGPDEQAQSNAEGATHYRNTWTFVVGGVEQQERRLDFFVSASGLRSGGAETGLCHYRERVAREASLDGFLRSCWPRVRDWKYTGTEMRTADQESIARLAGMGVDIPAGQLFDRLGMTVTPPDMTDRMRFFTPDLGAPVLPRGTGWMTRPNV